MSAYLVSDDHLNVLVSYFVRWLDSQKLWCKVNDEYIYLTRDNAAAVAYALHRENVRSVDNRYNEANGDERYQFRFIESAHQSYKIAEIAGAIDCLEYQSCERDDYYESEAYGILCSMRKQLLKFVAEEQLGDETTWEISKAKTAAGSIS